MSRAPPPAPWARDAGPRGSSPVPPQPLAHGGDLAGAAALYGGPAGGWLDLSTGINPHPYPVPELPPRCWTRLPQRDDEAVLLDEARRRYGVLQEAEVVAAAGSQALIQWLPHLRVPGRVAVLGPTYGEYARCWRKAGHEVEEVASLADLARADVAVLANPNNPDGRGVPPADLGALRSDLAARSGWLVVDEAFADTAPELTFAAEAGSPGLIVLRSFGKFYGLAGVRLGFALTDATLAGRLRSRLGPWAVAGPALEIGRIALADREWAHTMRRRLAREAVALDAVLAGHGLDVVGGTTLFRLVATPAAPALHARLAQRGILIRHFAQRPDWLRIGLPPDGRALSRLDAALCEALAPAAVSA